MNKSNFRHYENNFSFLRSWQGIILAVSAAVCLLLFAGCDSFNWYGKFAEEIKQETETEICFYADVPGTDVNYFKRGYRIGTEINNFQLPDRRDREVFNLKPGYTVLGWIYVPDATKGKNLPVIENSAEGYIESMRIPLDTFSVYAKWEASRDTPYKVCHYFQKLESDEYELLYTDDFEGTTDTLTQVVARDVEGFSALPIEQAVIGGRGDTVINIYYDRIRYTFSFDFNYEGACEDITRKYGTPLDVSSINIPERDNYEVIGWQALYEDGSTETITELPAIINQNITFTAIWKRLAGDVSGDIQVNFDEIEFKLSYVPGIGGHELKLIVNAYLGDRLLSLRNVTAEFYDPTMGLIESRISSGADSVEFILNSSWEAGDYYIRITANPVVTYEDGSPLVLPVETVYIKVEKR